MTRHSLSIALCTYNGIPFVGEQLASLARQTRLPDELVVCDDGSTDATLQEVRRFAGQAPFPVRVWGNPATLGSTANFEQAVRLCSGEIIFLCDQDDVWRADKIERLSACLEQNPADLAAFSNARVVDAQLADLGYMLWDAIGFDRRQQRQWNRGDEIGVLLRQNVVTGATLAFRANLRSTALPIPAIWVHDGWLAVCAALSGRVAAIPESLIDYRQHARNQIGGVKKGIGETLSLTQHTGQAAYQRLAAQFIEVRQRWHGSPAAEGALGAAIEGKITHSLARASMPHPLSERLLAVTREWRSGRYHRYSRGWRSAVKDVMLGRNP